MEAQDPSDLGPLVEFDLEVNSSRLNELGVFDRKQSTPAEQFDHERRQLLTDGHSLGSKMQSRLNLVKFGKHTGGNGCLVVLSIDFKPRSSTGVLRFRDATVEVQVGPGRGQDVQDAQKQTPYDKRGPRIVAFDPHYAEGPAKNTLQKFNIKGGLDRVVEWKLEENNSAGDGLPPLYNSAFVVRWEDDANFYLKMSMRALTVGGIPVIGRATGAIYFTPDSCVDSALIDLATSKALTSAISGGLVGAGKKIFVNPDRNGEVAAGGLDLAKIDLSLLTQVDVMLRKE